MGKFVVSTTANGGFRFNLKADNGQTILTSESYTSKAGCLNGIESVKKNAGDDNKYGSLEAEDGRTLFQPQGG
ncbi:MAG: YegP family protein [Flavihumibacter sp.]